MQRMILYAAQKYQERVSKKLVEQAEYRRTFQKIVENIHDARIRDEQYELLVFLEGWPNAKDHTWELLTNL